MEKISLKKNNGNSFDFSIKGATAGKIMSLMNALDAYQERSVIAKELFETIKNTVPDEKLKQLENPWR